MSAKVGPDTISPERAPRLAIALRFFLAGLIFLAGLLGLVIYKAPMIAQEYLHNQATLAMTHLFTLGFGASIVLGAVYQMAPVLLYSYLHSEALAGLHLGVHVVGVSSMVYGFYGAHAPFVAWGGSLVLTGALLFAYNLGRTFARAERWNVHGWPMVTALFYFLCTLGWGVVLAFNQWHGFLGEVEGAPLNAHLALGLAGFFGLMIVGVGMKLIPMFAPGKPLPAQLVAATAAGVAMGVPVYITGLWTWGPLLWLGALLLTAGFLTYGGTVIYSYRKRRSGPLDFSIRFSLTALPALAVAALGLLARLAGLWPYRPLNATLVFLFALGWIGSTILGMLLRIIPFMVWLHRFRNRTQKLEKVPFLHEMFHPRLGWTAYSAWFGAIVLMTLGFALTSGLLLALGGAAGLAGLAAYGVAVGQILRHVPPGTPALYPGRKP